MFFAPSKSRYRAKIWKLGVSKTSDNIKIKIKIQDPSQEPPETSKAQNQDLKDVDVLFTKIWNIDLSKTSDNTQIQIKNPNPFQEHPAL